MRLTPSKVKPRLRGAGDAIAVVAEPIKAWTQKHVWKEAFRDCHCEAWKDFLNRKFPFRWNNG